jgi:repressor LexA
MTETPSFLTRRQKEILEFIRDFNEREGISPTHREICERFGYSSYGTVHKHLRLLREKGFVRRVENQKRGIELVDPEEDRQLADVPFYGRIAAGRPIEALPGDDSLGVPPSLLAGSADDHYILRVSGNSMIEEGIHDGDFVVVRRRELARPGEMVVALIDGEATLKRFYPEGGRVRLQPANAEMEPIFVAADQLRVQGVVVGLMRKY